MSTGWGWPLCGALALGWLARSLWCGAARAEGAAEAGRVAGPGGGVELARRFELRGVWAAVAARGGGAVCAGWVLVGGLRRGRLVGLVAGFGVWRWRQRRRSRRRWRSTTRALAARQLPLAADLLAACIAAGAGPVVAAQAVGEALGGPVGERLARGAAEVRLGGEPVEAWRKLASIPGAGALARLLERAGESGVPAAVPVARLAAEARAEWGRTATARARRAAVLVTAPVGLCFLPAFLAIGVLPVVIGLAGGLLGGGGG